MTTEVLDPDALDASVDGVADTRGKRFWQTLDHDLDKALTPERVVFVAVLAFAWFYVRHVGLRHSQFGSFDYDLGLWDQYIWLMAHGESFNTIRGLHNYGFHASFSLYLFVPFYWLGAGPWLINTAMVLSVAVGGIAVFRLAKDVLDDEWLSVALAVAYLANFSLQWQMHETFHPETLAIGPMLFAFNAARDGKWFRFGVLAVFVVMLKEDLGLAMAMTGFVIAFRRIDGQPSAAHRRAGALTFVLGAGWFLVATKFILPHYAGEAFYQDFYSGLGDGFVGYANTAVTNPTEYWRAFDRADGVGYTRDLHASYGFVSFLSPTHLLIGLPQLLANTLSHVSNSWSPRLHYAAAPVVASTIAMVHGVGVPSSAKLRRILGVVVLVSAVATGTVWGNTQASPVYRNGFWPLVESPHYVDRVAAVESIDDDAAVAASYNMAPHLSRRSEIYTFPNPWLESNWGIYGRDTHDSSVIDVIVVDLTVTNDQARSLLSSIIDNNDEWIITQFGTEIIVAERQR